MRHVVIMENSFEKIYAVVRRIPFGRVTSYGQIARMLGDPRMSHVVGYAMHAAPDPLPCHRVVNRFGGLSGAFSPAGKETHRLLLEMEGVTFTPDGCVDMPHFFWDGSEDKEQTLDS